VKVQTGQVIPTVGIGQLMPNPDFKRFVDWCLIRHQDGDWGDCSEEDKARNNISLEIGARVISEYHFTPDLATIHPDAKIWIITEASRLTTTVLLPSEY